MFLSKFLLKRPLIVNLLTLVILLLGILVLTSVNRATYPDVNFELMLVTTEYPGASSEDVEVNVTNKIEKKHDLNKYNWQKPHKPNLTGTKSAYFPNKNKNVNEKKYKTWKK